MSGPKDSYTSVVAEYLHRSEMTNPPPPVPPTPPPAQICPLFTVLILNCQKNL
jgi:hypothetical protein